VSSALFGANVDLQYTPLPVNLYPGGHATYPIAFSGVADLLRHPHTSIPAGSQDTLTTYPALLRPSVLPDDHLACVDSCYWMLESPDKDDMHGEWRKGLGVWQTVARHAPFRAELQDLAKAALRDLFGIKRTEAVPPVSCPRLIHQLSCR
jgi:hypothetical protein